MVAILILLTIITCLTVDYFAERAALRRAARKGASLPERPVSVRTPEDLTRVPAGVFVGPGHAWLQLEPAGSVRVGVDRVPISLLGGVEKIDAVPVGTAVRPGDCLAVLHQGERDLELKSPVGGMVTAVNPIAAVNPARISQEPFENGWLVGIAPRNLAGSLRQLFVADEARAFLRDELAHLRDFLVGLSLAGRGSLATATLPDGGLPVDGLAGRLSAGEWRELTERFF
ncbi:MAG TPA: glycine cleavage system protein H [Thermoanaerobaculia bacterium]|nr:glycine cleavage system protein H [Thermoanaerobaculia bacterium]